jgi:uncharacterized membrane protein
MFCVKCGKELDNNASFCPYCGNKTNHGENDSNRQVGYINRADFQENYRRLNRPAASQTTTIIIVMSAISGIMCIMGIFMPYIKASATNLYIEKTFQELSESFYIVFAGLGLVGIILSILKKFLGSAAAGGIYLFLYLISTTDYWENLKQYADEAYITKEIGLFCMVGGSIALIILGFAGFVSKLTNKA